MLGWNPLSILDREKLFESINQSTCKGEVLIYPHTTYADFFLFMLYAFAEPNLWNSMLTLINSSDYYQYYFIFKYLPFCPARTLEAQKLRDSKLLKESNKIPNEESTVSLICQRLKNKLELGQSFLFFISPEGTIEKSKWRSGYYAVASSLKCPIRVVGLDYEKHQIVICPKREIEDIPAQLEESLQKDMYNIVPLFPEDSWTPSRPSRSRSFIRPQNLIIGLSWISFFWTPSPLLSSNNSSFFLIIYMLINVLAIKHLIYTIILPTREEFAMLVEEGKNLGLSLVLTCMLFSGSLVAWKTHFLIRFIIADLLLHPHIIHFVHNSFSIKLYSSYISLFCLISLLFFPFVNILQLY